MLFLSLLRQEGARQQIQGILQPPVEFYKRSWHACLRIDERNVISLASRRIGSFKPFFLLSFSFFFSFFFLPSLLETHVFIVHILRVLDGPKRRDAISPVRDQHRARTLSRYIVLSRRSQVTGRTTILKIQPRDPRDGLECLVVANLETTVPCVPRDP